ncbi:MAG TPA: zf-HC2 domain-containing protein [Bacillota bacterium]|nr:zf-HC2 domain-containing protein [Bacillota bacterium]
MTCNEYRQFMHEHLDGQLSREKEKKLREHLETCKSCQTHFQQLNETLTLVQSTPKMNAPDNFTANVMDKLPEEKKHMKYRRWFSKHPYLPAVAVVLFFFVASLFSGWGKGTELVVSKKDDLIIEGDTVIVPEDIVVSGDLFIKNGNLKVIGQIEGDVTLVNGELLSENEMTASIDNISGELKQIDRALKWAWYEVNKFVSDLFSFN